ncbi:MAG: DUF1844 domain-containing protein [Desulfobacteraceae bacterium]|nr:DUF1844 domain-containing protein [Desulfobacteraceae bacterium]
MEEQVDRGEQACPPGQVRRGGECVMPEVTFTAFIISLNTSALYHLGEIGGPGSDEKNKDLVLAKHVIDTLRVIEEKTRGNLDQEEEELLRNILYDLKLRYVKAKD